MKKFLGVPVLNMGIGWKAVGFNILEFLFAFLLPAILYLHLSGNLQESNTPFYVGLVAGSIGLIVQHIFKIIMNKRLKLSFYNKKLNIIYLIVMIVGALALFEIWGM